VRFTGLAIDEVAAMASTIPAAYMGMTTAGTMNAEWDPASGELQICDVVCPTDARSEFRPSEGDARHAEARSKSRPSEGGTS
jgi:hypothetical protein